MTALERAKKSLAFRCTGDELRCMDGNGCECEMRGEAIEDPRDLLAVLVAEIDAAPEGKISGFLQRCRACEVIVEGTETPMVGKRVKILEVG